MGKERTGARHLIPRLKRPAAMFVTGMAKTADRFPGRSGDTVSLVPPRFAIRTPFCQWSALPRFHTSPSDP